MDEEIWAVGGREELDASRGGKGCESFCGSPTQALGLCWHLVAGPSHCRIRTQSLENGVCKLEARGRGGSCRWGKRNGFLALPVDPTPLCLGVGRQSNQTSGRPSCAHPGALFQ